MDDTLLASKLDFNRAAFNDGSGQMAVVTNTGDVSPLGTAANTTNSTVISLASTINFRDSERSSTSPDPRASLCRRPTL